MARPTRLDLEGGWYHVLNRGIERRSIFKSSNCYSHFVELLSRLPKRFGVRIHGYVLMANHYHLQIEAPQANLSRAIQWLNVSYSIWFNRKYQPMGPLFVERMSQLLKGDRREQTGLRNIRFARLSWKQITERP
jgi:putative transposase